MFTIKNTKEMSPQIALDLVNPEIWEPVTEPKVKKQKANRFVGEFYEGGIIFHLWEDTKGELHGLVVSLEKSKAFYPYSNLRNELIGSSAQSAWNGLANTLHIVQQNGHLRSCAEYCLQLNAQGYDDWYLPSIDELHLLWINRYNVNKALEFIDAEPIRIMDQFASSTEACPQKAWMLDFSTGALGCVPKWMPFRVRAIRQF